VDRKPIHLDLFLCLQHVFCMSSSSALRIVAFHIGIRICSMFSVYRFWLLILSAFVSSLWQRFKYVLLLESCNQFTTLSFRDEADPMGHPL
jgi:hypothetical protein